MKKIINKNTNFKENIIYPPSKSLTHRAIIAASLANGKSTIKNISFSEDIKATIDAISTLGATANLVINKDKIFDIKINGINKDIKKEYYYLHSSESATTLRIMIPIVMTIFNESLFDSSPSLAKRPMDTYYDIFDRKNIPYSTTKGHLPLEINGKLKAGDYIIDTNISSQFISGMLYALPLLDESSKLILNGKISSKGYVDMTLNILEKFGINIRFDDDTFYIKGNQKYLPTDITIEDDFSLMANFIVAKKLGKKINLKNLNKEKSIQKDKIILDIIEFKNTLKIFNMKNEKSAILSVDQIPDLMPILALYFSLCDEFNLVIKDIERLRYKESDRIYTVTDTLSKIGANIKLNEDDIIITGQKSLQGGVIINPKNDHRIAMMAAIAGLFAERDVIIENPECVNKSYPDFWKNFE